MKKLKFIVLMMFLAGIMLSFSSCLVTRRHDNTRHDNGRHLGWFKNKHHHNNKSRTIRVVTYDNHKQPASKSSKSSKSKKK